MKKHTKRHLLYYFSEIKKIISDLPVNYDYTQLYSLQAIINNQNSDEFDYLTVIHVEDYQTEYFKIFNERDKPISKIIQ